MNGTGRAVLLLVLTLAGIVHGGAVFDRPGHTRAQTKTLDRPQTRAALDAMPRGVADMVEAIKAAVATQRIEDLNDAIDWNEMKPDLGPSASQDPVAHWKRLSRDGEGKEILDVLGKLLAGKPAVLPFGKDIENNRLFVWPAFADVPLSKLSAADLDVLAALTTPEARKAMQDKDRYSGWRLVIGADGTWHSFRTD